MRLQTPGVRTLRDSAVTSGPGRGPQTTRNPRLPDLCRCDGQPLTEGYRCLKCGRDTLTVAQTWDTIDQLAELIAERTAA